MAKTIDLPSDGSVLGAVLVVDRGSSGGSSVLGDIHSHGSINNHSLDHVRVVVALVIDNNEDLALDSNLCGSISEKSSIAENSIIERSLVLVDSSTGSSSRVGPVDFVGLTDLHVSAVLPLVLCGELGMKTDSNSEN